MRQIIILFFLFSCTHISFAQWKQKEFVIGTFADPNLSVPEDHQKDVASFKRAKDAYINLLCGPQFYTGSRTFSMMDRVLKVANEVGLKLLVIDSRMTITTDTFATRSADFLIRYFKAADVENKNTLYGYNFGGEFPAALAPRVRKWIGYFKRSHPNKLIYTYLLPRYGFPTNAAYESYLDQYIKEDNAKTAPDVVGMDYYPFIGQDKLRDTYFYNLKVIADKAKSRPFWVYVLTTKHLVYPSPDEYQLNFTSFCPIAYGCKGLIYFTYETLPKSQVLFGDGLIGRNGAPTPKYYMAKKINHFITDVIGPIVISSTRLGTYHTGTRAGDENVQSQLLTKNNKYIRACNSPDLLIGIFRNKANPGLYSFFVVNKSNQALADVVLKLNSQLGNTYSLSATSGAYNGASPFQVIKPPVEGGMATVSLQLGPGESRVINISNRK